MENSKRKFWAKEILIFWTSLLAMFLIYLIVLGWVKASDHFTNKKIKSQNEKIQSSLDYIKAENDSLAKTPKFTSIFPKIGTPKEVKRKKLYDLLKKEKLYTKTFYEFKTDYMSDEAQKFLHKELSERGYDTKTFDVFQENFFGDMLAIKPEWESNQKLIQENRTVWNDLNRRKVKTFRNTHVYLELFALVWFAIVYPLRGIIFSILWAYRTLKEK